MWGVGPTFTMENGEIGGEAVSDEHCAIKRASTGVGQWRVRGDQRKSCAAMLTVRYLIEISFANNFFNTIFPAWLASSHEPNRLKDSSNGKASRSRKISRVYWFGAGHRCFTSTRR